MRVDPPVIAGKIFDTGAPIPIRLLFHLESEAGGAGVRVILRFQQEQAMNVVPFAVSLPLLWRQPSHPLASAISSPSCSISSCAGLGWCCAAISE